jgi:pyruvate dehydrogenase E1 component alpha subunit
MAAHDEPRLLELYERMLLIRETELRLAALFQAAKIPGFIHLSVGQEATAVGVAAALQQNDTLASTHRGHGHALAKGMDPGRLIAEIMGKAEGVCAGRGGSLHVADFSIGMLGANGIVGAGIPIALGSALAHRILKTHHVSVAFFGDGALAEGVLYESLNLAKLWSLPLLFVCEHNGWSEFSPSNSQYTGSLAGLAQCFGVPCLTVNGNDVVDVLHAATDAVTALRAGNGPAVLDCRTNRARGHYEGDPQAYRKDVKEETALDPLEVTAERLLKANVSTQQLEEVRAGATALIDRAAQVAVDGSVPDFEQARREVYLSGAIG